MKLLLALWLAVVPYARAENFEVIDPVGEENLGYLNVLAPTGPAVSTYPAQVTHLESRTPIQFGIPLRLVAQIHHLKIDSEIYNAQSPDLQIVAGETLTVGLGAYRPVFHWDNFSIDFGPAPQLAVSFGDIPHDFLNPARVRAANDPAKFLKEPFWSGVPPKYLPTYPVRHQFSFYPPILGSVAVDIVPGGHQDANIDPGDKRTILRLKTPTRVFPEAAPQFVTKDKTVTWMQRQATRDPATLRFSTDRDKTVKKIYPVDLEASETTKDFRGFSLAGMEKPLNQAQTLFSVNSYALVLNNTHLHFYDMNPGAIVEVPVKRIDVNDIRITRENGTVYYARGSYSVKRTDVDEEVCVTTMVWEDCRGQKIPTKTGVDVVPGNYVVTVSYRTEENRPETKTYELDLR